MDHSHSAFTLHRWCLTYAPLVWTFVVSDLGTALAYFGISGVLIAALAKNKIRFRQHSVLWLFGAFIMGCGLTHLMGAWTMVVRPDYYAEAGVKLATMVVSVATFAVLIRKIRYYENFRDLDEYREANHDLRNQLHTLTNQNAELMHLVREGNRSAHLERQVLIKDARENIIRVNEALGKVVGAVQAIQELHASQRPRTEG